MKAHDLLKDFREAGELSDGPDPDVRGGIFSDVYGTLIVDGKIDERYHAFLVWVAEQKIPVTLMSSDPQQAASDLRRLQCHDALRDTLTHKIDVAAEPLEAVIDDAPIFYDSEIVINPKNKNFREFLSTSRYKNHGRSHPANLPHRRGP